MHVAFTGTREGMTIPQKAAVTALVEMSGKGDGYETEADTYAHGDCVGADSDFHDILLPYLGVQAYGLHIFPPQEGKHRAHRKEGTIHTTDGYLKRNRDIVDYGWDASTGVLIACPKERPNDGDRVTGGTWYTVNYAMTKRVPVIVVWPNGVVERLTNVAQRG